LVFGDVANAWDPNIAILRELCPLGVGDENLLPVGSQF